MIKKVLYLMIATSFLFVGCGPHGKYADAKQYMKKMAKVMNKYADSLENAKESKDVVKAINEYSEELTDVINEGKKFSEKYPELNKMSKEENDKIFSEENKLLETATKKMVKSNMKLMQKFYSNKDVMGALEKLNKNMSRK